MNYLAHLLLSADTPQSRVGNLLGDFIKPHQAQHLPDALRAGMALHHAIDRYTDSHPIVRQSKARVAAERRRFAGILVDIFYDHYLARHWAQFHPLPLEAFTARCYHELHQQHQWLPPRLQTILPIMERENWLLCYRDIDGIAEVLQAFSQHRLSRPNPIGEGIRDLRERHAEFEQDFLAFFPQLAAHMAEPIRRTSQTAPD